MRHIGPEGRVVRRELEGRAEALASAPRIQISPIRSGSNSPAPALVMQQRLELVEGDLADHRVQHVLDLAGQHQTAAGRVGLGIQQRAEGQHLAEHAGRLGQGQRRAGASGSPGSPASTWCTPWPSSCASVITSRGVAVIVHQQIRMR